MPWLQLDPTSIAERFRSAPGCPPPPGLAGSLLRGMVGFTLTSVAGFVPWAVFGQYLHPVVGEEGMYAACALVFMATSGLCLHGLIMGPGSMKRFYGLFTPAFALYAVIWTACWMHSRGRVGGAAGLLGGAAAMGALLVFAFRAPAHYLPVVASLFLGNAAGYFGGGWIEEELIHHRLAAMLLWGACFGLGFGAGLGLAFYLCQGRARALLAARRVG